MPDDIKEVAEQTTDEETGFGTFLDEKAAEEKPDTEKTEVSEKKKPDEKVEDEKKPEEKPEDGDKKKADEGEAKPEEGEETPEEDDEITAVKKRLEDAAKERGLTDDDESGGTVTPPGGDDDRVDDSAASTRITKERFLDITGYIPDDLLPDGEYVIGDETYDFAKLREDDPEMCEFTKFVAVTAAQKMAQDIVKNAGFVHVDDVKDLRKEVNNLRFWSDITEVHEDGRRINKSPEFLAWKAEQPKSLQKLMSDATADQAIDFLTMFKKDRDAKAAAEIAGKQRGKKQKKDDLHKDTLRSTQDEEKKGEKGTGSDEDAGFHSYYDK